VRRAIGDDGQRQRLIRTIQRRGYRFVGPVVEDTAAAPNPAPAGASAIRSGGRPAIHVRPLRVLSGDAALDSVAAGVTEDLAAALGNCGWLDVWPGVARTPAEAGPDPAVRYLLDGSLRQAIDATRVSVRMLDAESGLQMWAGHFDLEPGATLQVQDRVTARIVGAVGPRLERAEIERVRRGPARDGDPYALTMRGMNLAFQWTEPSMQAALDLFRCALECEPDFVPASAMAAYCYVQRRSYGWTADDRTDASDCAHFVQRVVQAGSDDGVALARAAHALAAVVGDLDGALALIGRAQRLSPGHALVWYVSGWLQLFAGHPRTALEHLETASRLSPDHPLAFKMQAAVAYAQFLEGHEDEAGRSAARALHVRPDYHTALRAAAAAQASLGRTTEARSLLARVRAANPGLRSSGLPRLLPFQRPADLERWAEGLRLAGLPD
jgi:TolB-like protein